MTMEPAVDPATRWVLHESRGLRRGTAIGALVALGGGVAMTIASGGRGDTPLIAFGPMSLVTGLGLAWMWLSARRGELVVDGDVYRWRSGVFAPERSIHLSQVVRVRGGVGRRLDYVVATDAAGTRAKIRLSARDPRMVRHLAAGLLSSGADIDPECLVALRSITGAGRDTPTAEGSALVRLDDQGRLRWPRGTFLGFFRGILLLLMGLMMFTAPQTSIRWIGAFAVVCGVALVAIPIRSHRADRRAAQDLHTGQLGDTDHENGLR
jgi:hypothetical protein